MRGSVQPQMRTRRVVSRRLLGGVRTAALASCAVLAGGCLASSSAPSAHLQPRQGVLLVSGHQPSIVDALLSGVSCPATTECIAVGGYAVGEYSGHAFPLAERWNGSSWSIMTMPHLSSVPGSQLADVSCASPVTCVAVGERGGGFSGPPPLDTTLGSETLAERWNGSSWKLMAMPALAGSSSLSGVSCSAADRCVAVGARFVSDDIIPLAEQWNGTGWKAMPMPPTSGSLSAVSCPTDASPCMAVGERDGATTNRSLFFPLAFGWNGRSWAVEHVVTPRLPRGICSGRVVLPGCLVHHFGLVLRRRRARVEIRPASERPAPRAMERREVACVELPW